MDKINLSIKTHYRTYKKFNDIGLAEELGEILRQNQIDYLLEDSTPPFDLSFANNRINDEYRIKIDPTEFIKVNELLEQQALVQLNNVDKSHYLYTFNTEELLDLISKKDEWSEFDYLLAQKILKERNVNLDSKVLSEIDAQRIDELSKPEQLNTSWLYIGFLLALLGGIFGILIGWYISTNSRTLPNGKVVYCYSEADRNKGKWIEVLGVIVFILCFVSQIIKQFQGL
jgi:ABC-type lipoprotein release transport system permease subunit